MKKQAAAFDFGENWLAYSQKALTDERIAQAARAFEQLMQGVDLVGRSFLDIGFGQGLSLLQAAKMGARVVGNDINPTCELVLQHNALRLHHWSELPAKVVVGSILHADTLAAIRHHVSSFDVVHSWGVLHHTGHMWKAVDTAASLVKPGGVLVLALYNRHWSAPLWWAVKWAYVDGPRWFRLPMVWGFYGIIAAAKFLVTGRNPFAKERGMSFYYDVVDWVGGFPYEYASAQEVERYLTQAGFRLLKLRKPTSPTGCNEFVFQKKNTD